MADSGDAFFRLLVVMFVVGVLGSVYSLVMLLLELRAREALKAEYRELCTPRDDVKAREAHGRWMRRYCGRDASEIDGETA